MKNRIPLCDICGAEAPNVIPCLSTDVWCDECEGKIERGEMPIPPRPRSEIKWKYLNTSPAREQ